jgi:hypothetical protein
MGPGEGGSKWVEFSPYRSSRICKVLYFTIYDALGAKNRGVNEPGIRKGIPPAGRR